MCSKQAGKQQMGHIPSCEAWAGLSQGRPGWAGDPNSWEGSFSSMGTSTSGCIGRATQVAQPPPSAWPDTKHLGCGEVASCSILQHEQSCSIYICQ